MDPQHDAPTTPSTPGTVTDSYSAGGHDYTFAEFGVGPGGVAANPAAVVALNGITI